MSIGIWRQCGISWRQSGIGQAQCDLCEILFFPSFLNIKIIRKNTRNLRKTTPSLVRKEFSGVRMIISCGFLAKLIVTKHVKQGLKSITPYNYWAPR